MSKYEQRGVSRTKIDIKNAMQNNDLGLYPQSFCKVIPDILTDSKKNLFGPSYCNIMHNNGAGTKAVLAYLGCSCLFILEGNRRYFRLERYCAGCHCYEH